MIEAQMPSNLDLEYSLLGAVILNNSLMNKLSFLSSSHFYSSPHSAIFASMRMLHDAGEPITPFKIKVDNTALFDDAGGLVRYLSGTVSAASSIFDAIADAKLLVSLSQKRLFIQSCQQAATQAAESNNDVSEHATSLSSEIETLMRGGATSFEDDYVVTAKILEELKSVKRPTPTGLYRLDNAMGGGLFAGKSYGFAARKKVGKTILAGTISCNLAMAGVKHLFICGEMSPQEIHQRTLARLTNRYPSDFISEDRINARLMSDVAEVARQSKRCTLYHNAPGLLFDELRRVIATAVYTQGIKGFILDYWQLVGGKRKGQNSSEHLDEVAQWIADTCRKFGIWSITMAQLNQDGNTRGGEGLRLAFDQVYAIRGVSRTENNQEIEDITDPHRWLQMLDTRYTKWCDVGESSKPGLLVCDRGPYFECVNDV